LGHQSERFLGKAGGLHQLNLIRPTWTAIFLALQASRLKFAGQHWQRYLLRLVGHLERPSRSRGATIQ